MKELKNDQLERKLEKIFQFLVKNRQYNHDLHEIVYISTILPFSTTEDKIISLLYSVANTQSQPKIDNLANFYIKIQTDTSCLKSMKSFVEKINPGKSVNFENLYKGMQEQDGWGPKTAALFTKNIYHMHNGGYLKKLRVWDDVPKEISEKDKFFLPVDIVITEIFRKLYQRNWDFNSINSYLGDKYKGKDIEVWDDLWFWGFVTQKGAGKNREFEWNENKYWSLKESNKDPETIKEIKEKAEEFLKILTA